MEGGRWIERSVGRGKSVENMGMDSNGLTIDEQSRTECSLEPTGEVV